jgi:hypothetical protein
MTNSRRRTWQELYYLQTLLTALLYFCPLFICLFWGENVFFYYLLFAFILVWRGCKICFHICISKFQRLSFSMLFLATFIDVKKVCIINCRSKTHKLQTIPGNSHSICKHNNVQVEVAMDIKQTDIFHWCEEGVSWFFDNHTYYL